MRRLAPVWADGLALAAAAPGVASALRTTTTDITPAVLPQPVTPDLAGAPPGYRDDMLTCLGMSGRTSTAQQVHDAALRLASGTVAALQARPELAAGSFEPGLPEALADGRVMRLLTQP